MWFACDYGPGDPLRWSPSSVEIFLADWYARKVFGVSQKEMRRIPQLLAGFVRFAHERTAVPAELTEDTLTAIEYLRGRFLALTMRPGRSPYGGAARLARIAAGLGVSDPSGGPADPDFALDDIDVEFDLDVLGFDADGYDDEVEEVDDPFGVFEESIDEADYMTRVVASLEARLIETLGGRDAYESFDDSPLADAPVDWSTIPEPQRALAVATAQLLDEWAAELFDVEVRTIARHVLAGVVRADPAVFSRSPRYDALAAGLLWHLHGRLTTSVRGSNASLAWSDLRQKDLAARSGVSASLISTRSRTVANVVARANIDWPNLLHSAQRRDALRARGEIRAWRAAQS